MIGQKLWREVTLAFLAGIMGGMISGGLTIEAPAFAQRGSNHAEIISAQEFRVLDSKGREVSTWGALSGNPRMVFGGSDTQPHAVYGILGDGTPGFSLYGEEGVNHAELRVGLMGHPSLKLYDVKGKKTALLGAHGLGLFNGELRGRLTLASDGVLSLDLKDRASEFSSALMVLSSDKPMMALSDRHGRIVWSSP